MRFSTSDFIVSMRRLLVSQEIEELKMFIRNQGLSYFEHFMEQITTSRGVPKSILMGGPDNTSKPKKTFKVYNAKNELIYCNYPEEGTITFEGKTRWRGI